MMFCRYGHMTECHFPLDCAQAACGHLPQYEDFSPAQLDDMERRAKSLLAVLAEVDREGMAGECPECQGQGWIEKTFPISVTAPPGSLAYGSSEIKVTGAAICKCAIRAALALEADVGG